MSEEKKKKTRKGILAGGIVFLIAVLIGVIVYLLLSRNATPEEERRNVVITPENVDDVLDELDQSDEKVTPGYYTVTMNPTWHFSKGNEVSYDAVVENVEANTNDVYFDIVLENDENTVLYKSPVIPRGGKLEQIALDQTLDVGTHSCIVIYHLIDDDQKTLSTLRVTLSIVVEE